MAAQGEPIGLDDPDGTPPSTAATAIDLLGRAHDRWDADLELVRPDRLAEQVGEAAGPQFATRSRSAYVLDEYIHHGSEIGLLRDLWRWQRGTIHDDPLMERVIRGDAERGTHHACW